MFLGKHPNSTGGWVSQCLDNTKERGYITTGTVGPDPRLIQVYNQTINKKWKMLWKPQRSKRGAVPLLSGIIILTGMPVTLAQENKYNTCHHKKVTAPIVTMAD